MIKKNFDCINMKREIQEKVYKKTKGNIEKIIQTGDSLLQKSELWKHFCKGSPSATA